MTKLLARVPLSAVLAAHLQFLRDVAKEYVGEPENRGLGVPMTLGQVRALVQRLEESLPVAEPASVTIPGPGKAGQVLVQVKAEGLPEWVDAPPEAPPVQVTLPDDVLMGARCCGPRCGGMGVVYDWEERCVYCVGGPGV